MPSRKALIKAQHAFKRALETEGPEVAQKALDKRGGQVPPALKARAQRMIDAARGKAKGGIIRRNYGGPVMANRGGIFKQSQPMQKGSPYRGILMNKFNRRQ